MNADGHVHLTLGILALGLLIGTLAGPVSQLQTLTTFDLQSQSYWLDLASSTLRAFAAASASVIGVVGASLGIPMYQNRNADKQSVKVDPPAPGA